MEELKNKVPAPEVKPKSVESFDSSIFGIVDGMISDIAGFIPFIDIFG